MYTFQQDLLVSVTQIFTKLVKNGVQPSSQWFQVTRLLVLSLLSAKMSLTSKLETMLVLDALLTHAETARTAKTLKVTTV
jgi:hypothetical protein